MFGTTPFAGLPIADDGDRAAVAHSLVCDNAAFSHIGGGFGFDFGFFAPGPAIGCVGSPAGLRLAGAVTLQAGTIGLVAAVLTFDLTTRLDGAAIALGGSAIEPPHTASLQVVGSNLNFSGGALSLASDAKIQSAVASFAPIGGPLIFFRWEPVAPADATWSDVAPALATWIEVQPHN